MKKDKIIYWGTTGLICAFMAMSSFMYFSKSPQLMESLKSSGIPYYFIVLLGIFKVLGILALLFSKWNTLKEWAYAGFTFTFLGAVWIHAATSTPFVAPLIALVLLSVSYLYWNKLKSNKDNA